MKLLFCIKALNDVGGGGAERVLTDIANGLSRRGADVTVLSFDPPGGEPFYPLDPAIARIELGLGPTAERATLDITLQRMRALRAAVVQEAPDVAIGFMHSMYVPLGFALLGSGVPVVASEHIVKQHYRSRRLEALALMATPFLVRRITCVSPQAKEGHSALLRRKMVPVANPVTVRPAGRADVVGKPGERKVLLSVGRLVDQKDPQTLIAAFAMLAQRFPDWDLRIMGDGELRPALEAQIARLGLQDRVAMPGAVKDIGKEYLGAQLFVLASRYESFGLTTAEALGHGLPAVGFADCAGTNQLIRPGINGELAEPGDDRATALAESLALLMGNAAKRQHYAQNALLIAGQHGLDTALNEWQALLVEILAKDTDRAALTPS